MEGSQTRRGFTLIEIMAVVLIIGLLSTLVGLAVLPRIEQGRAVAARAQMSTLETAVETYRMDNARFPTSEQGLQALVVGPSDARHYQPGGYLRGGRVPDDPWGSPYTYESPGQHNARGFDICSLGADGNVGGEGTDADICNWSETDLVGG